MQLCEAYDLADKIKGVLAPFCERIEVCGSIRRARPEVGDIDILCLAKPEQANALVARCKLNAHVISAGDQAMSLRLKNNVQVDVRFARASESDLVTTKPGNWGALMIYFTGSKEHNIFICDHAQKMGLKFDPFRGVLGHPGSWQEKVVASETEEDIFKYLGLEFIPPVQRER